MSLVYKLIVNIDCCHQFQYLATINGSKIVMQLYIVVKEGDLVNLPDPEWRQCVFEQTKDLECPLLQQI